jgi:hypothetical protein
LSDDLGARQASRFRDAKRRQAMDAVTFSIGGKAVAQEELLVLEVRRARRMMALLMRKLGSEGMADLFASEIAETANREQAWHKNSRARVAPSIANAHVREGNAVEFVQWFLAGYMGPNAPAMMRAHPEHLGALQLPDGRVGILEVPGHMDIPGLLYLRRLEIWPQDTSIELDPSMPVRIMGVLEAQDETVHGYLLHQFRDTSPGFDAKLAVYWPAAAPEAMVSGHADHLALEFNNWLQAYLVTRKQPADLMPISLSVNV